MTAPGAPATMDHAARLDRLARRLDELGCDGLLVTALTNVRYLTGFTGSAGVLLVDRGGGLLVTDGRYREQAAEELRDAGLAGGEAGVELAIAPAPAAERDVLAGRVTGRLGLEADHVSWSRQRRLAEWFPGSELVATSGVVEALRAVKDPGEVARIAAAAAIADAALEAVRPLLDERPSEAEVALALDDAVRAAGADGPAFDTIVATGPSASRPHHRPGSRRLEAGHLVVIDFGATVDGYRSDMTRTIAVGGADALDPERRRLLDVVTEAQAAGVAAVRPGAPARAVDAACRAVIAEAGWGDAFVHGTGHGVGLDIHEEPRVAATSAATLDAGHVITVEPGAYLAGLGGVRVEDTLVVTPTGCEALTRAPKDPASEVHRCRP